MRLSTSFPSALLSLSTLYAAVSGNVISKRVTSDIEERALEYVVKPKIFIISMFAPEEEIWYGIPEFDILGVNVTVPGASPLFPEAHCTVDGEICQLTTGESEINAASTISALVRSPRFDLRTTYFMVAGIAGGNPETTTICAVTFARYAVQVALQYELSGLPANITDEYIPQGSTSSGEYPQSIYGTEVFELNDNLRHIAAHFARNATLNDTTTAMEYRSLYNTSDLYKIGSSPPTINLCDVATSDVYFSGTHFSDEFYNYTNLLTNGSGVYCATAQEDNATLEALLRAAVNRLVDFSRIIVMRTISDFDRPYPGESTTENLFYAETGSYEPSVENIYLAGIKVIEGILGGWNTTFAYGINATNYIGDIFGTLGGEPNFGPGSVFLDDPILKKRTLGDMAAMRSKAKRSMISA